MREFMANFNPSFLEMILRGLRILNILITLKDDKSTDEEDSTKRSSEERQTIRKSFF